ncbi:hypothetical protein, partial [Proteus mirabilis]|uniref:hypothetical protein n=1 Tax=Proteus mirabilis TaxID=584 RepID=UPI001EF8226B
MGSVGIHRSYQVTFVFPYCSVLEYVRVAEQAHSDDATTFWRNVDHYDEFTLEKETRQSRSV